MGAKKDEPDIIQPRRLQEMFTADSQGDGGRPGDREPIGTGADGRKSNASGAALDRQGKAAPIRFGQQLILAPVAAVPARSHRMHHVGRGEVSRTRDHRLPRGTFPGRRTDGSTFPENGRASRPVDGAVHTPAAQEAAVGGVDDHIRILAGDVAHLDLDSRALDTHVRFPRLN